MRAAEARLKGAIATKRNHGLEICPCCGQIMQSGFYAENGRKGGEMTLQVHGRDFFSEIGKMGGRGNKRKRSAN